MFALVNGIIVRFIHVDLTSNFLQSLVRNRTELKCVTGEITKKNRRTYRRIYNFEDKISIFSLMHFMLS